jgi:hypothetical protein
MRFPLVLASFLLILTSCGKKVKDINSDDPLEAKDFIEAFLEKPLPIQFTQADIQKKENDSFFVKTKTVSQFIPDSIFTSYFGKLKDVKFYRKGRYKAETEETYLFLMAEKKEKKAAFIICFDKNLLFSAGMELTHKITEPGVTLDGGIDRKLTVIRTKNKPSKNGTFFYNKSAYVYNTEGLFTLILTESNEPVEEVEIYNPIDTFATKDLLSGEYAQDKKNFVSVRDGGKPGKLLFFLNVSKRNGSCDGSLRGDMVQVKPKVFQYNKADDHCIIEFTFSKNNVQVKELEACGNHRGVRCSFDGKFNKVKR